MTPYLLDVNVLIALIDPGHVQHDAAHDWFEELGKQAWATCPLTENGVLRIVGHKNYPNSPGSPAAVAPLLIGLCTLPGHTFWPDDISIISASAFEPGRLLSSSQVTDSYLLALAVRHSGKLATLDRRLVADAVPGGRAALSVIPARLKL